MPKRTMRDNLTTAQMGTAPGGADARGIADDRTKAAGRPHKGEAERAVVVPVVAEEINVSKRTVETGRVRVKKLIREREEVIDQPLLKTDVVVERVPVNRYVERAPAVRQEGESLVVPLVEEVIVVEKRLMLREELRINTRQVETRRPQRVTVRREDVQVDRVKGEGSGPGGTGIAKNKDTVNRSSRGGV